MQSLNVALIFWQRTSTLCISSQLDEDNVIFGRKKENCIQTVYTDEVLREGVQEPNSGSVGEWLSG